MYKPLKKDELALKMRITEITDTRVHYGYRRVHVLLRREGHTDNVKRIYRLYRARGLSLRLKRPRHNKQLSSGSPSRWPTPSTRSGAWISWPMRDALFDGRKLRMLKRWWICSRESVWPSRSLKA